MTEREGVIKFELRFAESAAAPAEVTTEIRRWHRRCHRLCLVGQDPERYLGLAYGNISQRHPQGGFLISGSQTGGQSELGDDDICRVMSWDIVHNRLDATGPIRPSSESLSHAALYQMDQAIGFVIHVHSPLIWHQAGQLGLPITPPQVEYGTPAMADAVAECCRRKGLTNSGVIAMGGHEDGILAFGQTATQAGELLLDCFARARELAESPA